MIMRDVRVLLALLALLSVPQMAGAAAVDDLLARYQAQGAASFDREAGARLWARTFPDAASGEARSCATCHGRDPQAAGRHATTGKPIDSMAPSINPKRLTDVAFIEKWFTRNCKWTLGRLCTPQEKGDLLLYLRQH